MATDRRFSSSSHRTGSLCSIILLTVLAALVAPAGAKAAEKISLNRGWTFQNLGTGITETVNVPHDYLIEQDWVAPGADERGDNTDAGANIKSRLSARGFKELNDGIYTKTLNAPEEWKDKQVILDFEGIMYVADVYLNGQLVGGTDYGYLGFEIDLSRKLDYGRDNELKVVCHQGDPKNSRWYTGGGLFRDVNLYLKDPQIHFLRHPLYITTRDNQAVNIGANVMCQTKQNFLLMHVCLSDPQGKVVCDEIYNLKRNRNFRVGEEMQLPEIAIPQPQLWSCETPELYSVQVELLREDSTVADSYSSRFGIRTVEIVPGKGLLLNGEKVLLKGYANHHDLGALGAAAYPRAIEKRIQLMKDFGLNHIRCSHNPYSESFLDLCDQYGILVVDELYDKWNDTYVGAGRKHFSELWQTHVPEFITRDRNHPCVVAWSLGNELQSYSDQPFNDFGVTMFQLMKTLIQRYDTTRKVTVAMHPRYRNWETDSLPCNLAMVTDFQSYNYRYMYFPGDGRRFPWMTFYQSEASVSAMGENYFAMDLDKVIGLAYWGAIDYLGESQGWPAKGWAQGVIDLSLEPKPKAYYMRSFFKEDEPVVHIAVTENQGGIMWNGVQVGNDGQSDHWNREPGQKLNITTYTNADEVELFVNGKSCGTQINPRDNAKMRNQIRWTDIVYEDGYCEAVARTAGKVVARHRIETTGKAVSLKIEADKPLAAKGVKYTDWKADGVDLQHLRIYAVDSKGRRVATATGEVQLSLKGDAATIAAMGNGNQRSHELNAVDRRSLFNGSVLAILRSDIEAGTVTVTAKCDGLKPASIKLYTK